jgi:hypothetical protein
MNYQTERYIRNLFQEAQRGICPICQKPLTGRISLDHSHSTGEPRGLLHQSCNMKVAQIETHTKKLNYIISRQLEARIRDYIAQHCRIFVSTLNEEIK